MKRFKALAEGLNLLNLLLLAAVIGLAAWATVPFITEGDSYSPPAVKESGEEADVKPAEIQFPAMMEYVGIPEKNLFHPERKLVTVEEKSVARPDIILFGTIVTDGVSYAYIEDKNNQKTTPGRGKRQSIVKQGESITGYTVKEISADKIVLVKGEDRMTVDLMDPRKDHSAATLPADVEQRRSMPAAQPTHQVAAPRTAPPASSPAVQPPGQRRPSIPAPGTPARPVLPGAPIRN